MTAEDQGASSGSRRRRDIFDLWRDHVRYSPTWIDGKKHARNVYAHTREECEEKLKVLIAEMKAELAELKRQKTDKH